MKVCIHLLTAPHRTFTRTLQSQALCNLKRSGHVMAAVPDPGATNTAAPPRVQPEDPSGGVAGVDVAAAAQKFGWDVNQRPDYASEPNVMAIPVASIRRPLAGIRSNNQEKVDALKQSIQEVGLLEPIDVLLVEGQYWGFSGCHRYQAHQELGKETILCRVRKANRQVLKFHMM